jgi:hypothetical protein
LSSHLYHQQKIILLNLRPDVLVLHLTPIGA